MPAAVLSRREKLDGARRTIISINLSPEAHAILATLAKATAAGNRSAVVERLILSTLSVPTQ